MTSWGNGGVDVALGFACAGVVVGGGVAVGDGIGLAVVDGVAVGTTVTGIGEGLVVAVAIGTWTGVDLGVWVAAGAGSKVGEGVANVEMTWPTGGGAPVGEMRTHASINAASNVIPRTGLRIRRFSLVYRYTEYQMSSRLCRTMRPLASGE